MNYTYENRIYFVEKDDESMMMMMNKLRRRIIYIMKNKVTSQLAQKVILIRPLDNRLR